MYNYYGVSFRGTPWVYLSEVYFGFISQGYALGVTLSGTPTTHYTDTHLHYRSQKFSLGRHKISLIYRSNSDCDRQVAEAFDIFLIIPLNNFSTLAAHKISKQFPGN